MSKDTKFHKEFIKGLHPKVSHKASKNSKSINYNLKVAKNPLSDSTHCSYVGTIHAKVDEQQTKLSNKVRSKYLTYQYLFPLIDLKSELHDAYWNTYRCCKTILQQGQTLTMEHCKNRWCIVCNRRRTSDLILAYGQELNKIENKVLLTLSRVSVPEDRLNAEISLILKDFGKIINTLEGKGRNKKIKGVRSTEITHNPNTKEFHPHIHGIFSIEDAIRIKKAWFDLCNKQGIKVSHKANKIVEADDNSILEVFKYCTKLFKINEKKIDQQGRQIITVNVKPLDTIFQVLKGRRVFSAYGMKKQKIEKRIDLDLYEFLDPKLEIWEWDPKIGNYVDAYDNTLTKDNFSKDYNVKIR